jgi:NAD(P)-dependent dehydrogenase (short-subunit alcohol dehydrogenase family)
LYFNNIGGVVSMTVPLARDLAPLGVRVLTVAPGYMETPMTAPLAHHPSLETLKKDVSFFFVLKLMP